MPQIQNPMEIFKYLDKSNCRKCNETTCLAFAAAVFRGVKEISECPTVDPEIAARYGGVEQKGSKVDQDLEAALAMLRQKMRDIDLEEAASRTGGFFANGKLTLKIMGKDFSVDKEGRFYTNLHTNPWIAGPVLRYILDARGKQASGNWVPLRELKGGKDWARFFNQRCEKPMKKVADEYTDLFGDMVDLFNGRKVKGHFNSDIAVRLSPLPMVPLLICYFKPEEGIGSDLQLYFDDTVEANLPIEALYTLGTGLTVMFEKIARRHG